MKNYTKFTHTFFFLNYFQTDCTYIKKNTVTYSGNNNSMLKINLKNNYQCPLILIFLN